MAKDKDAKDLQEKYIEFQMLSQQLSEMQKQLEAIEEQMEDISSIKSALSDFHSSQPGSEMLVPLASGVFAKAKLESNNSLIVNVGASTAVEKDVASTKALLDGQLSELANVHRQVQESVQESGARAKELSIELKSLVE